MVAYVLMFFYGLKLIMIHYFGKIVYYNNRVRVNNIYFDLATDEVMYTFLYLNMCVCLCVIIY